MERNVALVREKRPDAMTLAQEVAARATRIEYELEAEAEVAPPSRDLMAITEPSRSEQATEDQQFH